MENHWTEPPPSKDVLFDEVPGSVGLEQFTQIQHNVGHLNRNLPLRSDPGHIPSFSVGHDPGVHELGSPAHQPPGELLDQAENFWDGLLGRRQADFISKTGEAKEGKGWLRVESLSR